MGERKQEGREVVAVGVGDIKWSDVKYLVQYLACRKHSIVNSYFLLLLLLLLLLLFIIIIIIAATTTVTTMRIPGEISEIQFAVSI